MKMKKQSSILPRKRKWTTPVLDQNITQGQSSLKTVRDRLIPTLCINTNPKESTTARTQIKTKSLKVESKKMTFPRKKHSNSHIISSKPEIDSLIKLHRNKTHCSETIVIDTRGNNNLEVDPCNVNCVSKDQFKQLILKGNVKTTDKKNSLFITDNTVFNEKDKKEIDNVVPLESNTKDDEDSYTSSKLSLISYDDLTDLQDDSPEYCDNIAPGLVSSLPVSIFNINK